MHHVRREGRDSYAADRNAVVDELVPVFERVLKERPQIHVILFVASPLGYTVASSLPTDERAISLTKYIVSHHEKLTT
jgi:hypothetical protein